MNLFILFCVTVALLVMWLFAFVFWQWSITPRVRNEILHLLREHGSWMDARRMIDVSQSQGGLLWRGMIHRHLAWLMQDNMIEVINPTDRPAERRYRIKTSSTSYPTTL